MTRTVVFRRTALAVATAAAGVSSVFLSAAPAEAAPPSCGTGTAIAGNMCEQTFTTTGAAVFTPNATMSKLQILLVAGGGSGASGDAGYGGVAGGGGQVRFVDFTGDHSTPISLVVGAAGTASSAREGTGVLFAALPGGGAEFGTTVDPVTPGTPGASGNGHPGWPNSATDGQGGGGGDNATLGTPTNAFNGGGGATAASVAPAGSLFATDTTCYGGGGAVGKFNADPDTPSATLGAPGCGAGYATFASGDPDVTLVEPTPNTGGGGGALVDPDASFNVGASGVVVVRWSLVEPSLPATGGTLNPTMLPVGLAALGVGLAALTIGRRRIRRAN